MNTRGQGLIAGTNVPNCGVCSCLGLVQALFISTSVGSHTHTHTPCSDLTRGKVPASPHSHSSKIHKGKVLNDFLSLPVFTACCPHPPCLLPLRQRKSGRITAEVAAGFQCVYVCVCERVCVFALLDVPLCADTVVGHVQEGKRALMESFLSMLYQKHEEPPCWERSQAPAPPLPAPLFPSCTPSAALCLPPQPLSPVRRDSFHTGSKTSSFRAPVTVPKAHTICSPRSPSARARVCVSVRVQAYEQGCVMVVWV